MGTYKNINCPPNRLRASQQANKPTSQQQENNDHNSNSRYYCNRKANL